MDIYLNEDLMGKVLGNLKERLQSRTDRRLD